MTSLFENANLSILAIPAYHLISGLARGASTFYATNGHPSRWDNCSPRSDATKSAIAKRIGPERYAVYERLVAAHDNCVENIPIFAAAIILGNMAGLHKVEGPAGLNWFAGAFLLVRTAYIFVYTLNNTQTKSAARSVVHNLSLILCYRVFFKTAVALA